jgi:hypothetical protein
MKELDGFIDKFSLEMAALTRAVLEKMRKRLPGSTEMIYDNYNALVIGFGPSERASEAVFSIAVYPRWINLFFLQGASLPDADKILKGTGNQVRSIKITDAADLDKREVREIMKVAMNAADPPIDPKAKGRRVIRAIAPKQRPRRP